jgi:DNA primase
MGIPGASNWKPHWNRVLDDYSTVFCFSDPDPDGQKFAKRLITEVNAINIKMPDGEDVNSMYLKEGAQYLRNRIKGERK